MSFFDSVSRDQLWLNSEYEDVQVTMLENDFSYPGTVSLKKNGSVLKIYAVGSMPLSSWEHGKFLHFKCKNKTIIVFNAYFRRFSSRTLPGDTSKQEWAVFKELEASFDFAYIGSNGYYSDDNVEDIFITGFDISFPKLINLIGDTTTQGAILHGNNTDYASLNLCEFSQVLDGIGSISVSYDYKHANSNITTAKTLTPKLSIDFFENKPLASLDKDILKLYNIIAFFMGGDFDIDHISISRPNVSHPVQDDSAYLSFPKVKKYKDSFILPFGINQAAWSSFSELPTELFNKYYQLSDDDQSIFEKYTRYKRLNTAEDRFLGYFRLLEKLTLIKKYYVSEESLEQVLVKADGYLKKKLIGERRDIRNLIKRIKYLNSLKNNTESCLREFYNLLPNDIKKELNIDNPNFTSICKLRNDITHANYYELDDAELFEYERFIHALLFLSLLKKLDVPVEVCLPIMHKLKYF